MSSRHFVYKIWVAEEKTRMPSEVKTGQVYDAGRIYVNALAHARLLRDGPCAEHGHICKRPNRGYMHG